MLTMVRLLVVPLLLAMCTNNTGPSNRPPAPAPTAPVVDPPTPTPTAPVADPAPPAPPPVADPPAPATTAPTTAPAAPACINRGTAPRADGGQDSCYPYLCRAGACLTRCKDRSDCAGAQVPAELATLGWPLECQPSGECTPMDPDKVH
jgi:hypothetical protein